MPTAEPPGATNHPEKKTQHGPVIFQCLLARHAVEAPLLAAAGLKFVDQAKDA